MKRIDLQKINKYVEANVGSFHEARLRALEALKLTDVLKAKNPYLFRAKNIMTGHDLVKTILDAYLSSQEEGIFGAFLEGLAIYVCGEVYGGKKSAAEGIDLEFTRNGVVYVVTIKSGPKWGNSGQIANMKSNFKKAKTILRTNNSKAVVHAVNGCCYGRDKKPDKGDYQKLCGQRFWSFISGDDDLYIEIIEPLGHRAKEKNADFVRTYSQVMNRFEKEVLRDFVKDDLVDWQKLVQFNSGVGQIETKRKR